ncbi:MAG: MSMEG_0568 family radical SAM protein [Roseofilum sp. SBFL]|uniref:MSMEG_0568 family radical SAM protein n=1 Tax=unclassified Roseofilum TaxID=2620099 RepID=UPI001AFCED2F|nr:MULTISPECIES: MSMEG_0568 family radical SAM protein [unclassified Roseofilum]MBP0014410.1 MSMEG_0568 family radical SAM protein [Roseofilum sp. SID3]MBP0026521.1 MSMEG_0568 family radical SAM protein [Roseofilum sp. SID2]MBP0036223.1 MSMEG_0568 family radical SAM protein [Roseofilum sp. SID1]MBP0040418.1 MSMEG_0568 family radical SAM protein [Roseofilum sp. SBFL]
MNKQRLIVELQSQGLQLTGQNGGASGRQGGAGPSDHKAIAVNGTTVMVPVYTGTAADSPYSLASSHTEAIESTLAHCGETVASISFPRQPRFYDLKTAEGIPYKQIALLHSHDVLATTVLQTCMRYGDRESACQFCAIGQSLAAGQTIARKTPAQLAEVAEAAVRLDGVKQIVMTTGTPNTSDRGAAYLAECARAIKQRVNIPIQAQCEPPVDFIWFQRMRDAGIENLGMHLEAVTPEVRAKIMPGKAEVSLEYYFEAFAAAVEVFGWGQVSTYLLAGLGDSLEALIAVSDLLIQTGVYPFVVPFVPITGTPLEHTPAPDSEFMYRLYQAIGDLLRKAGMSSQNMQAGCAKCGACSALSTFES